MTDAEKLVVARLIQAIQADQAASAAQPVDLTEIEPGTNYVARVAALRVDARKVLDEAVAQAIRLIA